MKKSYLLFALYLCALSLFAQTPQKMNYQAVVRNSSDMVIANQTIGIQISILQTTSTGTAVYVETQSPTTNANGLISIEIGSGAIVSGDFTTIDWASDTYFIKTEVDTAGGTNYTITGTSQLMSVPYALHAKTAETVASITEADPIFGASAANGITNTDITNWNSKLTGSLANTNVFVGNDSNEATAVALSGDATLANDGTLTIEDGAVDGTDISLIGETAGDMAYFNGTEWVRLPKGTADQSLVMNASATAPEWQSGGPAEDVKTLLITGSTTALSGNETLNLPGGQTWQDIANDYETIYVSVLNSANGGVQTTQFDIEAVFEVNNWVYIDVNQIGGALYSIYLSGVAPTSTSITVNNNSASHSNFKLWGVKKQKVVVNPTDATVIDDDTFAAASSSNVPSAESVKAYIDASGAAINDQSASGYMDIGNMRIQWGQETYGGGIDTVTLPAPFKDANYAVTTNSNYNPGGAAVFSSARLLTSTGFSFVCAYATYTGTVNPTGHPMSWIAIGLKP